MNRPVAPPDVPPPAADYALAMVTTAGSQMLHTAGIVPTNPDGTVDDDIGRQSARVWQTIGSILTDAGFEPTDVVSYTTYVVSGADLDPVMRARDAFFGGHRAASVLVTVPALARAAWKVETAVVAARSG